MSKPLKILLYVVTALIGLLLLVIVAVRLFVDVNIYKPRLETAASDVLGMEVRVGAGLAVSFSPGLSVTLADVHIRNRGADVVFARQVRLGIDLLPLLQKQLRIGSITVSHPRISIERDRDGVFNVEPSHGLGGTLPALDLANVSLLNATLLYTDQPSGRSFEVVDCRLDLRRLRCPGGERANFLRKTALAAQFACGAIRIKDYTVADVSLSIAGKDGVFDIKPVMMRVFGGQGMGSVRVDFTGSTPLYEMHYSLTQFQLEEFLHVLSPQQVAQGSMDFSMDMSMQGEGMSGLRQTMVGRISLRGSDLTLTGRDLDAELSRYASSQNFNLVDVGAFFFAGPVGLVVTKGYDFASIFKGSKGSSQIRTLVSDWQVEGGVVRAQDVAMATNLNRIALKGELDFANEQFNDVTVALINSRGCATVQQKIRGSFHKPRVEKPGILKSLTGPAVHLLEKGRDLLPGGECTVFYAGSVTPPK